MNQYIEENLKHIVQFMAGKNHKYNIETIRKLMNYKNTDDIPSDDYAAIIDEIDNLRFGLVCAIINAQNAIKAGNFVRSL